MSLDQRLLETTRINYARMSDEQLALLFATRREDLSEEALIALREVLSERDPKNFASELEATQVELSRQAEEEERIAQADIRRRRLQFRVLTALLVVMLAVGGFLVLAGDAAGGYAVAGAVHLCTSFSI